MASPGGDSFEDTITKPPVALDLDGTITDCSARQIAVTESLIEEFGLPRVDAVEFWRLKRSGFTTLHALRKLNCIVAEIERFSRSWLSEIELPNRQALDTLLPGALTALNALRESGHDVTLITARQCRDEVFTTLERLSIASYFHSVHVVDPFNAIEAKSRVLSMQPYAASFGDSEVDARAASLASVPFYAVSSGQRNHGFLSELGIGCVFPTLEKAVAQFLSVQKPCSQS